MKLNISSILLFLSLMGFNSQSFAQTKVSGRVLDAITQKPLISATVSAGAQKTTTNNDGLFSITGATKITVSFIGYEPFTQIVGASSGTLTIYLTPIALSLAQVEVTNSSNPNKSVLYQPGSISKIGSTEIKRNTGLFMDDAIQTNITGVAMARRSVAGGQQLNIRGYGNGTRGTRGVSSNFDGQGYKVYLNGIPLTDAEGITTMDDIDFGTIANVEISKGPAGTLYGLAIAGAVNLTTEKAEKGKTSIAQQILTGSYGLRRFTTTLKAGSDKSSLLVNYGTQKTDGYTIHNASQKDFVNVVADLQPNTKNNFSV